MNILAVPHYQLNPSKGITSIHQQDYGFCFNDLSTTSKVHDTSRFMAMSKANVAVVQAHGSKGFYRVYYLIMSVTTNLTNLIFNDLFLSSPN